jgi:hypothetical protein
MRNNHITRSKSPIDNPYIIHNETLRAVPVATYLGIDISNNLSWNPHINKIVNKANSKLGSIKRNSFFFILQLTNTFFNHSKPYLKILFIG